MRMDRFGDLAFDLEAGEDRWIITAIEPLQL